MNGMISYDDLWKVMKEKGVSQYVLLKRYHISPGQIVRLKRNESVSTHTAEVFCKSLDCQVGDIMEYIPDEKEKGGAIHPFLCINTPVYRGGMHPINRSVCLYTKSIGWRDC